MELGYTLSSEENGAGALVAQAERAEAAGFGFAAISDHFHPWVDRQGESPFVWGVLGAISQRTERLGLVTGVTCPTMRIHPAIVAQAAATAASLLPGRFSLGVGSGENLNEHVVGERWPPVVERQERLEEAIEVIRKLWRGRLTSHRGRHFRVENARLYSLPQEPPPLLVAVAGERSVDLAARTADGIVGTSPIAESVERFRRGAGTAKPAYGQVHLCWAEDEAAARRTALEWWPNGAVSGSHFLELPLPAHFEEAAKLVREEDVAAAVVCGPDPERHAAAVQEFADAGYDHVYLHQVGPDQEGFFRFCERGYPPGRAPPTRPDRDLHRRPAGALRRAGERLPPLRAGLQRQRDRRLRRRRRWGADAASRLALRRRPRRPLGQLRLRLRARRPRRGRVLLRGRRPGPRRRPLRRDRARRGPDPDRFRGEPRGVAGRALRLRGDPRIQRPRPGRDPRLLAGTGRRPRTRGRFRCRLVRGRGDVAGRPLPVRLPVRADPALLRRRRRRADPAGGDRGARGRLCRHPEPLARRPLPLRRHLERGHPSVDLLLRDRGRRLADPERRPGGRGRLPAPLPGRLAGRHPPLCPGAELRPHPHRVGGTERPPGAAGRHAGRGRPLGRGHPGRPLPLLVHRHERARRGARRAGRPRARCRSTPRSARAPREGSSSSPARHRSPGSRPSRPRPARPPASTPPPPATPPASTGTSATGRRSPTAAPARPTSTRRPAPTR